MFLILVAGDYAICGDHGLGAVGADLHVTSVVQEDDVAAANVVCDLALDHLGRGRVPVVAGYIPHDRFQAKFAGYAEHGGAAASERRPEETRGFADRILQRGLAFRELPSDFCFAFEGQQRMRESVIADGVAGLDKLTCDFGTLPHVASDQKKGCVHAVPGEDFEQSHRVRFIGTIVVSERDLAGAARESSECFSIPLSGRRHGLVTCGCGCRDGDGVGKGEGEHVGIVFHWVIG